MVDALIRYKSGIVDIYTYPTMRDARQAARSTFRPWAPGPYQLDSFTFIEHKEAQPS